ncbi:hypothetical protein PR202_ga02167 [Eleusine coracana subsp. coracana]|uniref:MSP domain-containing protein n=1 Tax=Eleusine coracana subsp. coracana TaxID=191504 RepID=A0AAV5BK68_ELECO|nr:hypothetical protein PR202_ga02167 [Eleusine coracana subsp. coracana]
MGGGGTLISVYPEELTFLFELDKPCYCNLKVVNNSEHHVAFKVKTTSPRKYFVRPNASIVQPWDSCTITSRHLLLHVSVWDSWFGVLMCNCVRTCVPIWGFSYTPGTERMLKNASIEEIQNIQRLKEERDNMLQQNQQIQRELDVLRRRRSRKGDAGFSLTFAAFAGLIGVLVGLLMSLIFSPPPATA